LYYLLIESWDEIRCHGVSSVRLLYEPVAALVCIQYPQISGEQVKRGL